jgi:hypothetical protein
LINEVNAVEAHGQIANRDEICGRSASLSGNGRKERSAPGKVVTFLSLSVFGQPVTSVTMRSRHGAGPRQGIINQEDRIICITRK